MIDCLPCRFDAHLPFSSRRARAHPTERMGRAGSASPAGGIAIAQQVNRLMGEVMSTQRRQKPAQVAARHAREIFRLFHSGMGSTTQLLYKT